MTGLVLALDLGGTRLKAGLVDGATAQVHAATTAPTKDLDGDAALELLRRMATELLDGQRVAGIGVCVPGVVDGGRIVSLPGKFPGIVNRDIGAGLAQAGMPVTVVNDAIAYGAGEAVYGAGAGHQRVVVMTVGTGVGVCVLEDGQPLGRGPLGGGILSGQLPLGVPDQGARDTSGNSGTVEAVCRAAALVAEATGRGSTATDVRTVYDRAASGEAAAVAAVEHYRWWLSRGIVALSHAHTPSRVVLGGGPMTAGNPVLPGLQECVDAQLWPGYRVEVALAALGDHAALVGLAHLAGGAR